MESSACGLQAGVRGRRAVWLLSSGKQTFEPNVSF
jgi:hypothetical protein